MGIGMTGIIIIRASNKEIYFVLYYNLDRFKQNINSTTIV